MIDLPEQGEKVEAKVIHAINRNDATVRVSLRVEGREDFVKEWLISESMSTTSASGANASGSTPVVSRPGSCVHQFGVFR